MKIECPQCGSTELTKLSLIHATGLSDLNARSRGWGVLFGSGGTDLGFGTFKTKGEIQTRLSQKVSPPRKRSYLKILIGGLIGFFVLEFILGYFDTFLRFGGNFDQQLTWFGYGWLGIIAFILCITFRHNAWTVPKRYQVWDQSSMCCSCGHIAQLDQPGDPCGHAFIRQARSSLPPRGNE